MTHDTTTCLAATLDALLPSAIARAAQSYQQFSAQRDYSDAKAFTAYHNACKAALGHLAALGKLSKHAGATQTIPPEFETLLRHVRTTLVGHADAHDKNQL